ncbi:MAG: DUF6432 family protein [Halobacteriaceae archaeon]
MRAKRQYRRRGETQAAILDALVDRRDEGLTVLELRARVDVEIDELETALSELNEDALIAAERDGDRTVIKVADRVVEEGEPEPASMSWLDRIVARFRR